MKTAIARSWTREKYEARLRELELEFRGIYEQIGNVQFIKPNEVYDHRCLICGSPYRVEAKQLTREKNPRPCPKCKRSRRLLPETRFRQMIERLTGEDWSSNVSVLKAVDCPNPQIDLYNAKYHTGIEYDGRHHTESVYKGKSVQDQKQCDQNKEAGAAKVKMKFGRMSHAAYMELSFPERVQAAIELLRQINPAIPIIIDPTTLRPENFRDPELERCRQVAKTKQIEFLGDVFRGWTVKENWHCLVCDHHWPATPKRVINDGQNCPRCANKKRGCDRKTHPDTMAAKCSALGMRLNNKERYERASSEISVTCMHCQETAETRWRNIQESATRYGYACKLCRHPVK